MSLPNTSKLPPTNRSSNPAKQHRTPEETLRIRQWIEYRASKKRQQPPNSPPTPDNTPTDPKAKLITIKFKYGSNVEFVQLPASLTRADIALQIYDRLKITPWELKLISKGKTLDFHPSVPDPIADLDGKLILIMGTPREKLQAFRRAAHQSHLETEYYTDRENHFNDYWGEIDAVLLSNFRRTRSSPPTAPHPPDTRAFGLCANPTDSIQAHTSWLFNAGLVPSLDCACGPGALTPIACRHHADIFLIEWAAFVKLRLEFLHYALFFMRRPLLTTAQLREEKAALAKRFDAFIGAFNARDDEFLGMLLHELRDVERVLDFDPDLKKDRSDGRRMANEDTLDNVVDFYELEMAIDLLRGTYDPEDGAPGEVSGLGFLEFQRGRL